jgi:hypothetical protein
MLNSIDFPSLPFKYTEHRKTSQMKGMELNDNYVLNFSDVSIF